jgi:hypothetical protein
MANEENNQVTDPNNATNDGSLMDFLSPTYKPDLSDSFDMDKIQQGYTEMQNALATSQEKSKESMKDVITTLQDVTADKAVLKDTFNALESISFKDLIGKPIQAAIEAQADAAKSTLDFVKQLCTAGEDGTQKVAMVSFEFYKNGKKARMNLPLLSLVNIPSLEITQMTYKFTAQIDSHSSVIVTHNSSPTISAGMGTGGSTSEDKKKSDDKKTSDDKKKSEDTSEGKSKSSSKATSNETGSTSTDSTGTDKPAETKKDAQSEEAKAAANAKSNVTKETTFAANYTAQNGHSVTKDSKYAVSATMDISVTLAPDEIPSGIKTMLNILESSVEIVNPNGELTVTNPTVVMENGFAITSATYFDQDGVCAPSSIKCKASEGLPTPLVMTNADGVKILFTKPGLYLVGAGNLTEPVIVIDNTPKQTATEGSEGTSEETTTEEKTSKGKK